MKKALPTVPVVILCMLMASGCRDAEPAPVPSADASAVQIDEQEIFYDISGTTPEALRQAMLRLGPSIGETRFFGQTSWYVQWQFQYEPTEEGCVMRQVDVRLHVTKTLPRWTPSATVLPGLIRNWEIFYQRLYQHEQVHRDSGAEAAQHIIDTLMPMTAGSCDYLEVQGNKAAREIMEHYKNREQQYDARTQHGIAEGVVWPLK